MDRALFATAIAFPASLHCFTDLILHNRFPQAPQQGLCVFEEKAQILGNKLARRTAKSTDLAPLRFSIVKRRLDKNAYIHRGPRLVPKPYPTTSTTKFCPLPLSFGIEVRKLDHLMDRFDKTVTRVTLGILIAALIMGSSIVMTVVGGELPVGLGFFAMAGFFGAVAGGLWLMWSILRGSKD